MGTNRAFPSWDIANLVLEDIVDKNFKIRAIPRWDIEEACIVQLLTLDNDLRKIPEEYIESLEALYVEFVQDMYDVVSLQSIMDRYGDTYISQIALWKLEQEIDTAFTTWEGNHQSDIRSVLKGYFGVPQRIGDYNSFKASLH